MQKGMAHSVGRHTETDEEKLAAILPQAPFNDFGKAGTIWVLLQIPSEHCLNAHPPHTARQCKPHLPTLLRLINFVTSTGKFVVWKLIIQRHMLVQEVALRGSEKFRH